MSNRGEIRRPASLGRALRRGVRAAYDQLGWVVGITLASFAATAGVLSLSVWAANLAGVASGPFRVVIPLPGVFVYYLCAVGAFYYAGRSAAYRHPALGDFWTGVRVLFWPALVLFAIDALVGGVLVGDAVFFLALGSARNSGLFAALGVLCAYLAVVWATMCQYHLPLLVAQLDMESGPRPAVVIRKAFLLTADNPGFTATLFLVIIAIAVLCALPALIGMAILFLGATAFILTHSLRELFVRYGIVEEEPDLVEETPWRLPDSWRKRGSDDAHDPLAR